MIAFILFAMGCAFLGGFLSGFLVFGLLDKGEREREGFFPGEPDPPLYESPSWDLPGRRRKPVEAPPCKW